MKNIIFAGLCLLSAQAFGQIGGESRDVGQPSGTVLRQWLANTSTAWESAHRAISVKPGTAVNWSDIVQVEQVQTNNYAQEVITKSARQVYEVVSSYVVNEQDINCVN